MCTREVPHACVLTAYVHVCVLTDDTQLDCTLGGLADLFLICVGSVKHLYSRRPASIDGSTGNSQHSRVWCECKV